MSIGFWQIAIVVILVVLLFGRGKISSLMGDVAKGIKSFKKGLSDDNSSKDSDNNSTNNSDSEKLLEIFSTTEDLDEEQIVKASALIENAGGREATLEEADKHLKRAIEFLNNADIRKETFCELEEIAHFVVNRDS